MVCKNPPDFYCVILHMLTLPNGVCINNIYWYIRESNEIFSIKPQSLLSLDVNTRTMYFVKPVDSTVDPELIISISNDVHFSAKYPSDMIIKGEPFKLINLTLTSIETNAVITATLETASQVRWFPSPKYTRITSVNKSVGESLKNVYFLPGRAKDMQKSAFDKVIIEATHRRIVGKPKLLTDEDLLYDTVLVDYKEMMQENRKEGSKINEVKHEECTCLFKIYPTNPYLNDIEPTDIITPDTTKFDHEELETSPERSLEYSFRAGTQFPASLLSRLLKKSGSALKSEDMEVGLKSTSKDGIGGRGSPSHREPLPQEDIAYDELYRDLHNAYLLKELLDSYKEYVREGDTLKSDLPQDTEQEGGKDVVSGFISIFTNIFKSDKRASDVKDKTDKDFQDDLGATLKSDTNGENQQTMEFRPRAYPEEQDRKEGNVGDRGGSDLQDRNETAFVEPTYEQTKDMEVSASPTYKGQPGGAPGPSCTGGEWEPRFPQYSFEYDAVKEYFVTSGDEKLTRYNTI